MWSNGNQRRGLTRESRHIVIHARASLSGHLVTNVVGGERQWSGSLGWGQLRRILKSGDRGDVTGMESASSPTGFARWTGIGGEGDARDTIDTDGRVTKTGAELGHLRDILSSTASADSSLIFAKSASRADTTEGKGGSAAPPDSHAATDGSRSAGGRNGLPVG